VSDATNSNIPNPGVPFLDSSGRITQVWWAFLLAIFQRTGGSGTPTPPTQIDYSPLIDAQAPYPPAAIDPYGVALAPVAAPQIVFDAPPDAVAAPYIPADPVEDIFTAGTDFTPGTTVSLALSKVYASAPAVLVHFDGTFQATDQYSVSGNTITFTSAIPVGVSKVYARG
jgi:hypothetical protein